MYREVDSVQEVEKNIKTRGICTDGVLLLQLFVFRFYSCWHYLLDINAPPPLPVGVGVGVGVGLDTVSAPVQCAYHCPVYWVTAHCLLAVTAALKIPSMLLLQGKIVCPRGFPRLALSGRWLCFFGYSRSCKCSRTYMSNC